MKDDRLYLVHILERIERIETVTSAGKDEFLTDATVQEAVAYSFEVMGEAVKRLSAATTERAPQIPWREMAGLRDVLIHGYDRIYWDEVWKVVSQDLPQLKPQIQGLLDEMNEEAGADRL